MIAGSAPSFAVALGMRSGTVIMTFEARIGLHKIPTQFELIDNQARTDTSLLGIRTGTSIAVPPACCTVCAVSISPPAIKMFRVSSSG